MKRQTKGTLTLKCILTDAEKIKYAVESAGYVSRKQRADDELKTFNQQKRTEITQADGQINLLSEKINNGYEYRSVECEIEYNFKKKIKNWIRKDTKEIAQTDIILEEELQEDAFDQPKSQKHNADKILMVRVNPAVEGDPESYEAKFADPEKNDLIGVGATKKQAREDLLDKAGKAVMEKI